jgi:hypothetical protein
MAASGASAQVILLIEPRGDPKARDAVRHGAELKPLADEIHLAGSETAGPTTTG